MVLQAYHLAEVSLNSTSSNNVGDMLKDLCSSGKTSPRNYPYIHNITLFYSTLLSFFSYYHVTLHFHENYVRVLSYIEVSVHVFENIQKK